MLPGRLVKAYDIKSSTLSSDHDVVYQSVRNILRQLSKPPQASPLSSRLVKGYKIKSCSLLCHDIVHQSVKRIFRQLAQSQKTTLQPTNMSACPKCSTRLIHPPSVASLNARYPGLTANSTLDRSQPRCQHCDEMLAHRHAIEAELPPPKYQNPITKLERVIKTLEDLIEEDIEDEEDARTLKSIVQGMRRRWAGMVTKRDTAIKEAWKPYWAIWGMVTVGGGCGCGLARTDTR